MMNAQVAAITHTAGEILLLTALAVAVPAAVYADVEVLRDGLTEISVTEFSQSILLFLSSLIFCVEAKRRPQARGFLVLVAGFFACMFIREQDFYFDFIFREAWFFAALAAAFVALGLAVVWRESVFRPMVPFMRARSFLYIAVGMVIVIVFSRLFGSGRLFWADVMGADYKGIYKTIIQEGLELFGYVFIFLGSTAFVHEELIY